MLRGAGVFFYGTAKAFQKGLTEDPAEVRAIADGITSIDIPAGLRPIGGLDLVVPVLGNRLMSIAIFEEGASEGTLFLAEFPIKLEDTDTKSLEKQMSDQMAGQRNGPQEMDVRESRTLELTIRGKPAHFVIQKGTIRDRAQPHAGMPPNKPAEKPDANAADKTAKKADGAREMVGALGAFQGKRGAALIVIQLDAQRFKEEDVEKILRSIK